MFLVCLLVFAGGIEREWFALTTERLFDKQFGLFCNSSSTDNLGSYYINPLSHIAQPESHLDYFRFAGRFLAKGIMEQQSIAATLSLPLRKQILTLPITFSDLEFIDVDLYRNLCWIRDASDDDLVSCGLFFTVEYQYGEHSASYELRPGGADILVTSDNVEEFLELRLRHRMLDSIQPQLEALLKGFYEVLPCDLMSVFDYQELELLICGIPSLDLDDWMRHTEYLGEQSMHKTRPLL